MPWAVLAITLPVALTACTGPGHEAPGPTGAARSAEPDPALDPAEQFRLDFLTSNDLLYPPELWGALSVSVAAGLLRHQALQVVGEDAAWSLSPEDTYEAVSAELNGLEAAYLVTDAGLLAGGDPPWTADDVTGWWDLAIAERTTDYAWMAAELARDGGVDLVASPAALSVLSADASGNDLLPATLARELLAELAPEALAEVDTTRPARNVRSARDAGQLLYLAAARDGTPPSDADPLLLQMVTEAAAQDDWVYSYLVRAHAAASQPEEAEQAAATFDGRRLLADGTVLEPPVFQGSVGSTFRMVRHLDRTDAMTQLDPATREAIVEATRALLGTDLSHEVAGTATLAILDPGSTPPSVRQDVVARAVAGEVDPSGPLTLEQAIAWMSLAEYAVSMGVELPFPGLQAAAVEEWTREEADVVAPSIIRFLLALRDTAQLDGQDGVPELTAELQEVLAERDATELDSTVLFGAALAVLAVTGELPVPAETLAEEITRRTGGCRGGSDGYLREQHALGGICNVDSTLYAAEVADLVGAS